MFTNRIQMKRYIGLYKINFIRIFSFPYTFKCYEMILQCILYLYSHKANVYYIFILIKPMYNNGTEIKKKMKITTTSI